MSPSPSRRDLLVVALLGALLFLPGLGSRDLWNPDEPRYAEVAREMLASGQWLVPHLNGEVYTQKPPLLFWLMAASSAVRGGLDEVAARLPSALAGIATLMLVFLLGSRLFSRRAAWLAVAALGTANKFLWQGRVGQIDMLLLSLVTLAVWFWVRGETEQKPLFLRLFFVAAGLATLAKGPVGLLPPLLAILAFAALERDRAMVSRLRPWLGLGIWAAILLAWLVPAGWLAGQEYLQQIVYKQNITRYADPWHHREPFYYYLGVLPVDFLPWSLLAPGALVAGWRSWSGERGAGLGVRSPRGAFRFLLCWVVVTLVFFSLSPAKRTVYILTLYPGLALAVGAGLDALLAHWPRWRRWVIVPLGVVTGLFVALATLAFTVARQAESGGPLLPRLLARLPELPLLPPTLPRNLALWLAAGALGAALAFWHGLRGRGLLALGLLAGGMAIAELGLLLFVLPAANPIKSARAMAEELTARAAPTEPYALYPRLDAPVLFYSRRFAVWPQNQEELYAFAAGPGKRWLLIEKDDLEKLPRPLPLVEVARGVDPRDGYVLLASPPSGP
ncbi:MAG TPA: glycosyltransferase family 39 protein [Thermoanaerobaculia bacterium]|nr:glycosyltransferase family 39 protein [Thermoanaerobaculia bacterium]